MLLPESSCVYISSLRFVAPRVFLAEVSFLAFSYYHGNNYPDFLPIPPYFKFGQRLSSCQVSEKSTLRFSQNNGWYKHTNISFYICQWASCSFAAFYWCISGSILNEMCQYWRHSYFYTNIWWLNHTHNHTHEKVMTFMVKS